MTTLRAVEGEQVLDALRQSLGRSEEVLADVLVDDLAADLLRLREAESLQVPDELLHRLGEGRHVEDGPSRRGVREAELLRQDRLSRSGSAHHDVNRPLGKSPAENVVELRVA